MDPRYLIVNADDFGLSEGVNRGIIAAHEHGIVTSASLMVRGSAAVAAVAYARMRPQLDLGLHVDFGEWRFEEGKWQAVYEVVPIDDALVVEAEARHQLETFQRMVGAAPTHLDSHQHVHNRDAVLPTVLAMARSLGVPLRHHTPGLAYCGDFYGQTGDGEPLPSHICPEALISLIDGLPAGITELACHPGITEDELPTMYRDERAREVAALCDPRVRLAVARAGVILTRFSEMPRAKVAST